jgi:D-sedoheptulose 7-phosphate isomerase
VFARQLEALGRPGDVFVAISTSGKSPNILRAIDAALSRGMRVVGLTGETGGDMARACDICIRVPSSSTPRVQEMHILVGHVICELIEEGLGD